MKQNFQIKIATSFSNTNQETPKQLCFLMVKIKRPEKSQVRNEKIGERRVYLNEVSFK